MRISDWSSDVCSSDLVADGAFDPGDFGWMAGRFAAGGTAARAAWESIGTYQKACLTAATAKAKAELAALDAAPAALPPNSYVDDLFHGVVSAANITIGSETERPALPSRPPGARRLWVFVLPGGGS